MNFRKNQILIIGGGIGALLFIAAIVFLFINRGHYRASMNAFESATRRLNALNTRNPFPSDENVRIAGENLSLIKEKYETLQKNLIAAQINPEKIEPARFAPMLEEAIGRVRAKASEHRVTLPETPGLGFKDYAEGKLPPNDPAVLERLVVQVKALEDLVGVAIDAKVSSLDEIQRDDFELRQASTPAEEPVVMRGRGRGAITDAAAPAAEGYVPGVPVPAANPQYQTERFVMQVTGRESAIWEMLNRLVSRPVVYSIADITLDNTKTDVGRPVDMRQKIAALEAAAKTQAEAQPGAPAPKIDLIPREERVIGGREPVQARIVVDMFRFVNEPSQEGTP